jgi:anaerobic magnesium-protoporphyrin IX monomethyl ester cyclase
MGPKRLFLWVKLIEAVAQLRPKALLRWAWHPDPKIRHAIRWYYRMGRRVWIHELISFFFRDSLRLDGRTVSHHLGQPQDHEEEASRVGRRERSLQSAAGSVAG